MYNLQKTNKNGVCPFPPLGCLTSFPFNDYTFDKVTDWEVMQALSCKLNEVINFINTTLEKSINDYIDNKFNDMMLDTMYIAETETLVLYLTQKGGNE